MRVFAALTALVLLTAACGDDDDDDAGTSATTEAAEATTTTAAPEESPTTTAAEEASGAALVDVASSDLGDILVSEGRTLYIFMPDNAGPPTCTGDCAQAWPALLAEEGATLAGEGLDASLFGTVASADGAGEQVTVDGWPLYFFANDAAPGDTNGQGVGGVWFVVGPDGVPIEQSLEGLVGGY